MSKIQKISVTMMAVFGLMSAVSVEASASGRSMSKSPEYSGSGGSSSSAGMMADIAAHYVRDTRPDGTSDVGTKLSIGGMFSGSVGMDLVGMYEVKSANYLVGANLRVSPVSWLFLKGGIGGFAQRDNRVFQIVPLGGLGITAPISDVYYFLSEANYFQTRTAQNISFGAGLGMHF